MEEMFSAMLNLINEVIPFIGSPIDPIDQDRMIYQALSDLFDRKRFYERCEKGICGFSNRKGST